MIIELIGHDSRYKIEHLIRMFYPQGKFDFFDYSTTLIGDKISTEVCENKCGICIIVKILIEGKSSESIESIPKESTSSDQTKTMCVLLYKILSKSTGIYPPWGILTGVRPVAKVRELMQQKLKPANIIKKLQEDYLISEQKANLAIITANQQQNIIQHLHKNSCCVYISIPFCPSRCTYCSFVSETIESQYHLIDDYINLVIKELQLTLDFIKATDFKIKAVYIGGGTPTVLGVKNLEKLLKAISDNLNDISKVEFTLEAGRPDTINEEKLQLAKHYGVNRISVNPQTLNQETLEKIGRKHKVEDFFTAFNRVSEKEFNSINTDLILGLPAENPNSFLSGLNRIIELAPTNITIHTLTVKRAATINKNKAGYTVEEDLAKTLAISQKMLLEKGYNPYYLYRQKSSLQNQENVGYSKQGHNSVYNIAMMEDITTVFGIGAGATTKLILDGKIQRVYNFKFAYEYINRFNEILRRKTNYNMSSIKMMKFKKNVL